MMRTARMSIPVALATLMATIGITASFAHEQSGSMSTSMPIGSQENTEPSIEPHVLEEEADWWAREWSVSEAEATNQLMYQSSMSKLAGNIMVSYPEIFGGSYISRPDGRLVLQFTDVNQGIDIVDDLRHNYEWSDRVIVQEVAYSFAQLYDAYSTISEAVPLALKSTPGLVPTVELNEYRNVIEAHETLLGSEEIVRVASQFPSDMVRFTGQLEQPVEDACDFQVCDAPHRGGIRIENQDRSNADCSAGFVVSSRTFPDRQYLISAGHCSDIGDSYRQWTSTGTRFIGLVADSVDAGSVDAMRLSEIQDENWIDHGVYRHSGSPNFGITHVNQLSESIAGLAVLRSSENQGYQRATIRARFVSVGPNINFFRYTGSTTCGDDGDSGGSVYTVGSDAVGIHTNSDAGCTAGQNMYGPHMAYIQNELNVNVLLN